MLEVLVAIVLIVLALPLVAGAMMAAYGVPPARLRRVQIKWEPRDVWIGCFWDPKPALKVYVCLIPCVVVILSERAPAPRDSRLTTNEESTDA